MSGLLTRAIVGTLDRIASHFVSRDPASQHLETGRRGEEAAYFHLRTLGYVMVARNFRSSRRHGEIDLIGWDGEVLCFIEVKTRSSHDVKPAEAAVDHAKRRELAAVAREYLRSMPPSCQWRFDVVSVYYEEQSHEPRIELFQNAFYVS